MTEAVWLQLVIAGQAVIVALIGAVALVLSNTRKHVRDAASNAHEAKAQVANDHDENLRDDMDGKHDAVLEAVGKLDKRLEGLASDQRGMRRDIGRLANRTEKHEDRLDDLEHTQPPRSPWAQQPKEHDA